MVKLSKSFLILTMSLWLFVIFTPTAKAHVTVNPSNSEVNEYVKYSVRVPVEKEINTTQLELTIPKEINIISIEPVPDWDYNLEKSANEQITAINWIANNGGIGPDEFTEFSFIGVNPGESGEISWKALQTYEDESIVEWVDPPGSEEPASVTNIIEAGFDASSGGNTIARSNKNNWLALSIASLAMVLSLISLFRKRA